MKLIIIGNGMDRDHGLNTSYYDIFNEKELERMKEISFKTFSLASRDKDTLWSIFEEELGKVIDAFRGAFTDSRDIGQDGNMYRSRIREHYNEWVKFVKRISGNSIHDSSKNKEIMMESLKAFDCVNGFLLKDRTEEIINILIKGIKNAFDDIDYTIS